MDPRNKVALITGGKRIGAVVATTLAASGSDIALVYNRSRAEADETSVAVRGLGRRAFSVQADVTNEQACIEAVSSTVRELGRLDILINMASLLRLFSLSSSRLADTRISFSLRTTSSKCRYTLICSSRVESKTLMFSPT